MDKIRIKNLRSLQDTGEVEIKPLTLLVGKNSSGKSTFLRSFPLLKQTLETRTNEPILWYSSRYVDFGSFHESLNFNNKDETIGFQFDFKIPQVYMKYGIPNKSPWRVSRYGKRFIRLPKKEFSFNIDIECAEKYIKSVYLKFEDHIIDIEFKNKEKISKLKINNMEYIDDSCIPIYLRDSSSILPNVVFIEEERHQNSRRIKDVHTPEEIFSENIFKIFKKMAFGNTSNDTISDAIESIALGSSEDIFKSLNNLELKAKKLTEGIKKIRMEDEIFDQIKCNLIGIYLNDIISSCNKYFELDFLSINYIAPLRASAERYYRIQGLSVDEIDPQGTNIPMMIHNMTNKEKKNFISWTKENFNFEIITTLEGGHTSLKLKYNNDSEVINLADTGFGYSQLLPIILVMWQAINKNENKINSKEPRTLRGLVEKFEKSMHTIVIEQPELHLHPALQAKLIDTFVQIIMKSQEMDINIKFIIETHSETMLNRIGYLIAKKKYDFNSDLVNIVIFNKKDTYRSNVDITGYDERGRLIRWPIGFFSPEDF
ncbi:MULTISPECIES: AAA family ATPase [Bacillus cereus group]|uniref:AAA family ATPase n=1 Tax=Bacillus cereus group TaxID=86661 RepID=UPI0003107FBF|nr:AAA family ATPase [Bacillus cereus]